MLKRIITVSVILVLLFVITFGLHNYINNSDLSFSLLNIYSFHAISAIVVYTIVELVASKLPSQAGYAYLMMIFLKIGTFILIFQGSVFLKNDLSLPERISLIVPLFIFLIAEALAVAKLLNSQ